MSSRFLRNFENLLLMKPKVVYINLHGFSLKVFGKLCPNGPLGTYADFTSTTELPFASFLERVLVLNVSHEKDLIFMRMNRQVTYIFIRIVSHRGKSKLGIRLFIHKLLRERLINYANEWNRKTVVYCFVVGFQSQFTNTTCYL